MSSLSPLTFCSRAFPLAAILCTYTCFIQVPAIANADPVIPANHIRIHYHRPDGKYKGWTVYAFGDTTENTGDYNGGPVQVTGTDDFGAYFDVGVIANPQNVGIIIHNPTAPGGDIKDPGPNEFVDPSAAGIEYWALSGVDALYTARPTGSEPSTLEPGYARIHYYRPDGNFANWTVYSFNDTEEPTDNFNEGPTFVTGNDSYGAFYDVKLAPSPHDLGFIVHNVMTGVKDPGPDMHLNVAVYKQAWVISGDSTVYTSEPTAGQILNAGFSRLQAFWIDRTSIAIQPQFEQPGGTYSLVYSPTASLNITSAGTLTGGTGVALAPAGGLTSAELARFPQLSGYAVFHLPAGETTAVEKEMLKGQVAVTVANSAGTLKYVTGVQDAGVLDDLFYYPGALGAVFPSASGSAFTVNVWAPTAQSMKLLLYNHQGDSSPAATAPMTETNGVWTAKVDNAWKGKYYLFDVVVYVPSGHALIENIVTDPYSVDLALNGIKSRFTDLDDNRTKPEGWDASQSPLLRAKNDISVYELHVRDFSSDDPSVPAHYQGTYLAFTDPRTYGMKHLEQLGQAGLKAVHLLPTFHFATGDVNEDKSTWQSPGNLSPYPPDGTQQQAAIANVQNTDDYNWGYDPVHYFAPEGAYAYNPDNRVEEYRQMVLGLHQIGLRVIQDVVFNHTNSSGESPNSVLDEIVPDYYYRLDADGNVENGSCCADTASEHLMMEKLMIDAVVQSAREYKIDGFRFDLMSFHFVYNMQHIQNALSQLTLANDGIDGSKIYLYGEGWNFGETANDALGPNASQVNMYGTGIGTFNDRIRDGIRGGGPFSDERVQGFATGLFTDPSLYTNQNQASSDQQSMLLLESDWIRVGLAGNLRDFTFIDMNGNLVTGSGVNYNGQGVGYTQSPIEVVNYCSVHDNQTLFDAVQLKAAIPGSAGGDSIETRTRRQVLAMSVVGLGQGVPFFLAGDDLLRSKDMDNNSYNSGDWFNRIDFTYQSDNWGIGLPIASQNQSNWPIMQPLLEMPALKPAPADIAHSRDAFQEFLNIRSSSLLFHMSTLSEIQNNLHFLNTGPAQVPGLIVMKLDANGGFYGPFRHIVVVFNATDGTVHFQNDALKGLGLFLHPVQEGSSDPTVRASSFDTNTGTATVPALTTAVFVSWRE
ncbi:MAG: pullulanase-type alpha-1,6-glucosidase [Bryobacteraceae bacterium]